MQVLNFISVLLEHAGDKVIPFASQLSQFFQMVWLIDFCLINFLFAALYSFRISFGESWVRIVLLTYHHLLNVTLEGSKGDKMPTSLAICFIQVLCHSFNIYYWLSEKTHEYYRVMLYRFALDSICYQVLQGSKFVFAPFFFTRNRITISNFSGGWFNAIKGYLKFWEKGSIRWSF